MSISSDEIAKAYQWSKPLIKAAYLTGLYSFFGGVQIGAIWLFSRLSKNGDFDLEEIYLSGFILFFCISMLSSILIDYFITDKVKTNVYLNSLLVIICIIVCIASMLVYSKIFMEKEDINLEFCTNFQLIILGFTIYITFLLKAITLFKAKLS